MGKMDILFKRSYAWNDLPLPAYQTEGAAGMDLQACLPTNPIKILPGQSALVPTGWNIAIPQGFEGQVRPRSGLALSHGITVLNSPGTIDADYRGVLSVLLINHGRHPFKVEHGMRIAQLVIAPVYRAVVNEVEELPQASGNRVGGFGSTGV